MFPSYDLKKELEKLREKVNWNIKKEQYDLPYKIYDLIKDWNGPLPNLGDIFTAEEIDALLLTSIDYMSRSLDEHYVGERFIRFVAQTGYQHNLKFHEKGKLLLQRTTPVHHAAKRWFANRWSRTTMSDLLEIYGRFAVNYIDNGSNNDKGRTHFHVACEYECYDAVEKFLDFQQDPNCLEKSSGNSPLILTLTNYKVDVMQLLLERGADPNLANAEGSTPFHIICSNRSCDADLVNILRKYSLDKYRPLQVNAQDKSGNTPLHLAFQLGICGVEKAKLMLLCGANPNIANKKGFTPLHFMRDLNKDLVESFFKIIEKQNQTVQVEAQNNLGDTPLHSALWCENAKLAELLLKRGADPNLANRKKVTPLHIIGIIGGSRKESGEVAKKFFEINDELNQTLQINAQDNLGNTPLHYAVIKEYWDESELFLKRGANPNLTNKQGSTPLHLICQRKYDDDLVRQFFKLNDDIHQTVRIDAVDNLGRTPLEWAVANILPNVVGELLDRGADLSDFVFPTEGYFTKDYIKLIPDNAPLFFELRLASDILIIVEYLEEKGYELSQSDALTIMDFFVKYRLFDESAAIDARWSNNEEFVNSAKKIKIIPDLSLYDLIQLQPEKAAKLLTYTDYNEFNNNVKLWDLPQNSIRACSLYLCEKMSREFFRSWAMDPFFKMIHYRLPILCCEMIIENLTNKDFFNICLANEGRNS
uniref:Ankyrin repeat protein n=1 Tax=Trichogramma kaykai TaxID=54128 RepID=A0ABD2XSG4_9HYME